MTVPSAVCATTPTPTVLWSPEVGGFRFTVGFSGITVSFQLPGPITLPKRYAALQCENPERPDELYVLQLLTEPLPLPGSEVSSVWETKIYQSEKGWLHIFPNLGDGNGCQVACLFCPEGPHTIYYPASRWEEYSRVWNNAHLICGEQLLLRHDAFLLHSSVVLYQGKAVLFFGPSNAGKSTQAQLWHQHLGAKVVNGDRTVVRKTEDGFTGGGSIWSGTSGIYHPDYAPIAGIFLVEHGSENRVEPLGYRAFKPLLAQTLVNSWNVGFMNRVTELLSELMDQVPIYRLSCRPDKEAVELAKATLFPTEKGD